MAASHCGRIISTRSLPPVTRSLVLSLFFQTLLAILMSSVPYVDPALLIQSSFTSPISFPLTKIAVDNVSGTVFVGAMNRIYQLDNSLMMINSANTGPVNDSIYCTSYSDVGPTCSTVSLALTDNYNQVLVVDRKRSQVITCGTVYQGTCQSRSITNISHVTGSYMEGFYLQVSSINPSSRTVAFIAPGAPSSSGEMLYVGSSDPISYGQNVDGFRAYARGVTSRFIPGTDLRDQQRTLTPNVGGDGVGNTIGSFAIFWSPSYTAARYVAGFSVNGYSYFLSTQPAYVLTQTDMSTQTTSRIAQVCQSDALFGSFIEANITCRSGTKDFNRVQAAVLARPGVELASALSLDQSSDFIIVAAFYGDLDSAVCIYKLSDVQKRLTYNIQLSCSNSSALIGPHYKYGQLQNPSRLCDKQNIATTSYCDTLSPQPQALRSPLVDYQPILGSASAVYADVSITALAVTTIDNHTVVLLGTSNGRLLKSRLKNEDNPVYAIDVVSNTGSAVLDLQLSSSEPSVYGLTNSTVYKIALSYCDQYTSCQLCVGAMDPYCGWCTLQASCTRRVDCLNWSLYNRWQSNVTGQYSQCIDIVGVYPSQQVSIQRSVNLTIKTVAMPLPQFEGESYVCVFGSKDLQSSAIVSLGQLNCLSPFNKLTILPPQDHVDVNLTVQLVNSSVGFLSTTLTFYNCSVHVTCSVCTGSSWGCQWCVRDNRCIDSLTMCTSTASTNASMCPFIVDSAEKRVPSGLPMSIRVAGVNLPVLLSGDAGYYCQLYLNSQIVKIPATAASTSSIVCNSYNYTSNENIPQTVSLTVTWAGGFVIEGSVNVTVYSCSAMSQNDCGKCLYLKDVTELKRFGCIWCNGLCLPNDTNIATCIATCPQSTISSVTPASALVEGNTLITITGANLGYQRAQVQNAVTVAGIPCPVEQYSISTEIVCRLGSSPVPVSGPVNATIFGIAVWNGFQYKDPKPVNIIPAYGPVSGGFPLTISGTNLDAGDRNVVKVLIGRFPCFITSITDTQLVCDTTNGSSTVNEASVSVVYGNISRALPSNVTYSYRPDPTISGVNPQPAASFRSGGCRITLTGQHLLSSPAMTVRLTSKFSSFDIVPFTRTDTELVYYSPQIDSSVPTGTIYNVSLIMDGVVVVRSLQSPFNTFAVSADPSIPKFDGGNQVYQTSSPLIIAGSGFNTWCMRDSTQVTVTVGNQLCSNVSVFSDNNQNQIQCTPLGALDGSLTVNISVGNGSLMFQPGTISLPSNVWIGIPLIVGIVGGLIVIAVIVLIVCLLRRNSRKDRAYKELQGLFDQREKVIREQCKKAFADLQTEMTDLANELNQERVPFWDYRTYSSRMLFYDPGHPVLHKSKVETRDSHLNRFHQLLSSKYFLLVFIRTLEAQEKRFTMQDRTRVASLLMIVLMNKMELAVEIIKVLLDDLVKRSVEKKTAKTMLRRAESVVEKLLSNWLSLCMYDYLRTQPAGRSLYTLYQAVKRQTEKGPIDAVMHSAFYSLSENHLLHDVQEARQLNIKVQRIIVGKDMPVEEVSCKMLETDTITQAKEKALDALFPNVPFTKRPITKNVVLRLKATNSGLGLPLSDEDKTSVTENDWRRLNTLQHYSVKDGMTLTVVENETELDNSEDPAAFTENGYVELQSGSTAQRNIRLNRSFSSEPVYHLVRRTGSQHDVNNEQGAGAIPELFLTRLIQTKMSIITFIDDAFESFLQVNKTPVAIKFLFDYFDSTVQQLGIADPDEVTHSWKSNSLPLRFWVNVIQNPQFVFDIDKSDVISTSLTTIASAFIESCSYSDYRLTKDSPSSKLLFNKEVLKYRKMVSAYYKGVRDLPPVTEEEMKRTMIESYQQYAVEADFNFLEAVDQLYTYAHQFNHELIEALEEDESTRKMRSGKLFAELDNAISTGNTLSRT